MQQLAPHISLINQQTINIVWPDNWYQEDIDLLSDYLLNQLSGHKILEKTPGADRESIRFSWQKAQFTIHFDYYSQSCWLEGLNRQDNLYLPYLELALKQSK